MDLFICSSDSQRQWWPGPLDTVSLRAVTARHGRDHQAALLPCGLWGPRAATGTLPSPAASSLQVICWALRAALQHAFPIALILVVALEDTGLSTVTRGKAVCPLEGDEECALGFTCVSVISREGGTSSCLFLWLLIRWVVLTDGIVMRDTPPEVHRTILLFSQTISKQFYSTLVTWNHWSDPLAPFSD